MRRVRSGAIDSRLTTRYSKRLMPASRCSCASSAPGSCRTSRATAIQARCSSSDSQRGASGLAGGGATDMATPYDVDPT